MSLLGSNGASKRRIAIQMFGSRPMCATFSFKRCTWHKCDFKRITRFACLPMAVDRQRFKLKWKKGNDTRHCALTKTWKTKNIKIHFSVMHTHWLPPPPSSSSSLQRQRYSTPSNFSLLSQCIYKDSFTYATTETKWRNFLFPSTTCTQLLLLLHFTIFVSAENCFSCLCRWRFSLCWSPFRCTSNIFAYLLRAIELQWNAREHDHEYARTIVAIALKIFMQKEKEIANETFTFHSRSKSKCRFRRRVTDAHTHIHAGRYRRHIIKRGWIHTRDSKNIEEKRHQFVEQ